MLLLMYNTAFPSVSFHITRNIRETANLLYISAQIKAPQLSARNNFNFNFRDTEKWTLAGSVKKWIPDLRDSRDVPRDR